MASDSTIGINLLFKILESLVKKLENDNLKRDISTAIEKPLKDFQKATDKMIYALYLMSGSMTTGFFYEPTNPEYSANLIVSQFFKSFQEFIDRSKVLVRYLKTHKDELKSLLTPQENMIIDTFIESFNGDNLDLKFLYGDGIVKERIVDEYERKKKFPILLSEKFNEEMAKSPTLAVVNEIVNNPEMDMMAKLTQMLSEIALTNMVNVGDDTIDED
jgi:hypothetical protein